MEQDFHSLFKKELHTQTPSAIYTVGFCTTPHPKKRLEAKGLFYEEGKTERVSALGDTVTSPVAGRCTIFNTG